MKNHLSIGLLTLSLVSCGGGGASVTNPHELANITVAVSWYPGARSIRNDANSVKLIFEDSAGTIQFERVLNRPRRVDEIDQQTFSKAIQAGDYIATYVAFGGREGSGAELGRTSFRHEVIRGSDNRVPVVIGGIAAQVDLVGEFPRWVAMGDDEVIPRYSSTSEQGIATIDENTEMLINPSNAIVNHKYATPGWHYVSIRSGSNVVTRPTWVESTVALESGVDPNAPWPLTFGGPEGTQLGKGPGIISPRVTRLRLGHVPSWATQGYTVLVAQGGDLIIVAQYSSQFPQVPRLLRISPESGAVRFSLELPNVPYGNALLHRNGKLYLSEFNGQAVQTRNVATGVSESPRFNLGSSSGQPATLIPIGNFVVAGLDLIDISTGKVLAEAGQYSRGYAFGRLWADRKRCAWPGSRLWDSPSNVPDNGTLMGFAKSGPLFLSPGEQSFSLMDWKSGETLMRFSLSRRSFYSAVYRGEVVLIGDPSKTFAYSASTGALLWDKPAVSPIFAQDGTAYMFSRQGSGGSAITTVYALDVYSGQEKWRQPIPGQIVSTVAMGADGTLHMVTNMDEIVSIRE